MPLREQSKQIGGIATAHGCTFDIDCEDGRPCTDDFCDIGPGEAPFAGTCNNEVVENDDQGDLNGDDCMDGLACNGTETCQGATVYPCEGVCVGTCNGGTNNQEHCTVVGDCPDITGSCDGENTGDSCVRKTDCGGGGVCDSEVCVGGPNNGVSCDDNFECGSLPGACQDPGAGNDPIVCDTGLPVVWRSAPTTVTAMTA
jgi:hypothetical protein